MPLQAAFAQVDITPPIGTKKIGWLREIVADSVLDPLFARVAVIESGESRIAFVQLDTLCIRWTQTADIRRRVEQQYGFLGAGLMVSATHNHAGPAVASTGEVPRDDAYVETMVSRVVTAVGEALASLQPAELGLASSFEWEVGFNRRVVMRDGTVQTHGRFPDPDALFIEGPIDPEVAVLAARSKRGDLLGAIVNFACHPAHYGGDGALSAGFPGVLARELRARGCPVALYLNGACGNISTSDPRRDGRGVSMEAAGRALADNAAAAISRMQFRDDVELHSRSRTLALPFRAVTEEQVAGSVRGAQRFIDSAIYDRGMPRLLQRIRERKTQPAEVQVLSLDDYAFAAIPAEYFVELGLRLKEQAHPRRALVVSCANGMVGYVPHQEAFARGGYETTFAAHSKLAPSAGGLLADAAVDLIRSVPLRPPTP